MNYKNKIKNYCNELGIDTIGTIKCRIFDELTLVLKNRKLNGLENEFEESNLENRINPYKYMENGKTIISIAFPYLFHNKINKGVYFSKYTQGKDYHTVVSSYLKKICSYIESLGGKACYFVDSDALPERYIAYLAGIGFIGKNKMLITPKYGSYVFLGEIITDIDMEEDKPKKNLCGECSLCLDSCPTGALKEKNFNICLSYITQKKHIDDKWFEKLGGRIFGCDTCQRVCPFNKDISMSNLNEFKPYGFMSKINLDELIYINNKIFKEKYKLTSSGWRGKNILQRNAIINMMKLNNLHIDKEKINSPYILDYYNRLLDYFKL